MEFIITISEDGMIHPLTKRLYISMLPEEVIFHLCCHKNAKPIGRKI